MSTTHNNVGKCGHAKCAGGTGEHCYYKGAPMSRYYKIVYPDGRIVIDSAERPLDIIKRYDLATRENAGAVVSELEESPDA